MKKDTVNNYEKEAEIKLEEVPNNDGLIDVRNQINDPLLFDIGMHN